MSTDTCAAVRKYKKNMEISGISLIVIGAWSVLKFCLNILLGEQTFQELLRVSDADMAKYRGVYIVLSVIVFALFMLLYLYLGKSAVMYAVGRKKKKFFLYLAAFTGIAMIAGIPMYFTEKNASDHLNTIIASILVDLSTGFLLFDMVYSSVRLSRLRKAEEGDR